MIMPLSAEDEDTLHWRQSVDTNPICHQADLNFEKSLCLELRPTLTFCSLLETLIVYLNTMFNVYVINIMSDTFSEIVWADLYFLKCRD